MRHVGTALTTSPSELCTSGLQLTRLWQIRIEHERRRQKPPPVVSDILDDDDWNLIQLYHEILKPIKLATLLLHGQVGSRFGATWQVLPTYEVFLAHFEQLRTQYSVNTGGLNTSDFHLSTSINAAMQKLSNYYERLDDSPIYVAAIVFHSRLESR